MCSLSVSALQLSLPPGFTIQWVEREFDLEKVAQVINRAFLKCKFLIGDRISIEDLRTLISDPKVRLYVCLSPQNEVCATALITLEEKISELSLFSVHDKYHGLGSQLLKFVEQEAAQQFHVTEMKLSTFGDGLVGYYKSHGYRIIGSMPLPAMSSIKQEFWGKECTLMCKQLK